MIKVSDYIFDFLKSKGVDTIFSVSGGAAAHLLNSARSRDFTFICNYHEQACAMAAEGYARVSKKPACVLVTNGPGSSNTITGVLGAYQDSIPMIVISGQVPVNQSISSNKTSLRQLGVQECDIIKMVSSITKYAVQITNPLDVQHHVEQAYELSVSGRMGPVWLDIPLDIQNSLIDVKDSAQTIDTQRSSYDINEIIDILKSSKKPVIVTGNGIHLSNTEEKFHTLKNLLKVPVVSTWTSKDLLAHTDQFFVGNFGLLGERAANFAVQRADVLLILGSRLSIPNIGYRSDLFSPLSTKIMVDIDASELNKHTINIQFPIHDDLNNFLDLLITELQKCNNLPNWAEWITKTQEWKNKYPVFQEKYAEVPERINSFYFMKVLSQKIKDHHTIVTDMGTSYTCTMQSLQMNGKARLFTSSACCSMGFGLPGAVGAYYGNTSRDTILITGDGGLQMNIQELQTVIHNNIPLKIFVLNNNGYLAITLMQDNLFNGKYIGSNKESGVSSPNFVKLAEAYGFKTYKFSNNTELLSGIDSVLLETGPVLCEIDMIENQLLIPRVQSSKNSDGQIISNSLENMFPFLSDEEMNEIRSV
jgi:acetolactate synthase-1/2/3 large subunit